MNKKRKKQCSDKFSWPTMEAAKREVVMSKRVYAVWFNGERISRILLDRQEAEKHLVDANFVLKEKDISEEEYAALAATNLIGPPNTRKPKSTDKKPLPLFPLFPLSNRTAGSYEGWRESSELEPEPLKERHRAPLNYVIESDPAHPDMWMIVNPDADEQIEYYEVVRQIPTLQEAEEILYFLRSGATLRDYYERKRGVQ